MSGRYRAIRKIADGGTAEIFLAEREGEEGFRRQVVLKRIRREYVASELFRQMFLDEARLAMELQHSNIVQVLDLGRALDDTFMVLELVDGWTLAQLLKRARTASHPLPAALAVYIAAEVCRALAFAHNRVVNGQPLKVVHRDVCPYNVLVSSSGDVKLTDFGIAKTAISSHKTGVGVVKGKPGFMSPEQAMAQTLDGRSDLFSLGCVLYALLADDYPFKGAGGAEKMSATVRGDYVPLGKKVPALPKALVKVVEKAMALAPGERYQRAEELLQALEKVQRQSLEPMGRSELETWLSEVSAKDGARPLGVHDEPAPTPAQNDPSGMWLDISNEVSELVPVVVSRRWPRVLAALVVSSVIAGWFWLDKFAAPAVDAERTAEVEPPAPSPGPSVLSDEHAEVVELPVGVEALDAAFGEEFDAGPIEDVTAPVEEPPLVEPPLVAAEPEPPPTPAPVPSAIAAKELATRVRVVPSADRKADRVTLHIESQPSGASIRVDRKELAKTPAELKFRPGTTYAVEFKVVGKPALRQLLTIQQYANGKTAAWLKTVP